MQKGIDAYNGHEYTTAKKYFSDAYAEGHFKGARYMGILYEEGLGVTKDPKTAAMWYQKAADTNFDVMSVSL